MDADCGNERDLLDEKQVNRLFGDLSDRSLSRELVELFENESTRLLRELWSAERMGNYGRMRFLAHTLCGSSLNMGASVLARRLRELETRVQAGRSVESELKQLGPILEETLRVLRQH